jgi:hypothetical protein
LTLQRISDLFMDDKMVPYFITSRAPNDSLYWSQEWLKDHGFEGTPSVVVVKPGKKHLVLEAIGAQVLVDDYHENFRNLPPFTRGYLVDRPWNQGHDVPEGVIRIGEPETAILVEQTEGRL